MTRSLSWGRTWFLFSRRKLLAGNGCFIVARVVSAVQREFYSRVPQLNESFSRRADVLLLLSLAGGGTAGGRVLE